MRDVVVFLIQINSFSQNQNCAHDSVDSRAALALLLLTLNCHL